MEMAQATVSLAGSSGGLQNLIVGMPVEARYGVGEEWYRATITSVCATTIESSRGSMMYSLKYDDGDEESNAHRLKIRLKGEKQRGRLEVGESVDALCQRLDNSYVPGVIMHVLGDSDTSYTKRRYVVHFNVRELTGEGDAAGIDEEVSHDCIFGPYFNVKDEVEDVSSQPTPSPFAVGDLVLGNLNGEGASSPGTLCTGDLFDEFCVAVTALICSIPVSSVENPVKKIVEDDSQSDLALLVNYFSDWIAQEEFHMLQNLEEYSFMLCNLGLSHLLTNKAKLYDLKYQTDSRLLALSEVNVFLSNVLNDDANDSWSTRIDQLLKSSEYSSYWPETSDNSISVDSLVDLIISKLKGSDKLHESVVRIMLRSSMSSCGMACNLSGDSDVATVNVKAFQVFCCALGFHMPLNVIESCFLSIATDRGVVYTKDELDISCLLKIIFDGDSGKRLDATVADVRDAITVTQYVGGLCRVLLSSAYRVKFRLQSRSLGSASSKNDLLPML